MPLRLGTKVSDEELKTIIGGYIRNAITSYGSKLASERSKYLKYYYGEPLGDEQEGRSKVVLSEVHDVVEAIMPDLLDVFQGPDKVVEVEPQGPEDEEAAQQATDYLNFVWNQDNPGFDIAHDWIKDALIQKVGWIAVDWEKRHRVEKETFENATILDLQFWEKQEGTKIIRATPREVPDDPSLPDGKQYDVTIRRETDEGRVAVRNFPPEEMIVAPFSRKTDPEYCPFIAHAREFFASDLIEMGFSKSDIERIPPYQGLDFNQERLARFKDQLLYRSETMSQDDPSVQRIWVYDCYIRVDRDGDGRAELKHVLAAGPNAYLIFDEEDAVDHPFVDLTPIRMPHTWLGRGYAEVVTDLQEIKSTIFRQALDNMYNINNGRMAINELVNLEDLLVNRPDGIVRVEGTGAPLNSLAPIQPIALGPYVLPLMEKLDEIREIRTAVTRYNQGLDAQSLNKTASGINAIMNQSQRRTKLAAKTMAESFRRAHQKILANLVRHQDKKRVIRLRNKWVTMDPATWNPNMDVRINVGIGYGNKMQAAQEKIQLLGIQNEIVKLQGGAEGPLVTEQNVFNLVKAVMNDMGERMPERYISDPQNTPRPPPKQDPKIQLEMAKLQADQQRDQGKAQLDAAGQQQELQIMQQKVMAEIEGMKMKVQAEITLAREQAAADIAMRQQEMASKIEMRRQETQANIAFKAQQAAAAAAQPKTTETRQ